MRHGGRAASRGERIPPTRLRRSVKKAAGSTMPRRPGEEDEMATTDINVRNNIYQHFQVLKTNRNKRYKAGEFFVEGVRSINEAVRQGWHVKSFLFGRGRLSDWADDLLRTVGTQMNYRLTGELLGELSGKTDTSELMAVVEMREDKLQESYLSNNPFIVLFDRPSNRGNLGTMIRSCDALGADLLIMTGHGVDLYDPDVVVSAMGSFFKLPVVRVADNNELWNFVADVKKRHPDFQIIGTTAHRENPVQSIDLTGPLMLMIGNETMGLNQNFKEKCDILCTIPMAPDSYASSFNVSCAASIIMYEVTRQRWAERTTI